MQRLIKLKKTLSKAGLFAITPEAKKLSIEYAEIAYRLMPKELIDDACHSLNLLN